MLERVLDEAPGRFVELAWQQLLAAARPLAAVAAPPALRGYKVEASSAADYDHLLGGDGPICGPNSPVLAAAGLARNR